MPHFVKHSPCPKCYSRDNLGHYSDGSAWCFGCGYFKSPTLSPYVTEKQQEEEEELSITLPSDVTQDYPPHALEWAKLPITLLRKNNVYYSAYRNQLIFEFQDANNHTLAYQARNLSPVSKGKRYYTAGDVNSLLPIYASGLSERLLILVEDCLSAITISALGRDAMPLLGSGITRQKLSRLRHLYDTLEVWLDADMWPKAQTIVKQAQLVGFKATARYSKEDPKHLSAEEIKKVLDSS